MNAKAVFASEQARVVQALAIYITPIIGSTLLYLVYSIYSSNQMLVERRLDAIEAALRRG